MPIRFTVLTLSGRRYPVEVDDSADVFQLLNAVADATGIPRTQLEVSSRSTGRPLSAIKDRNIQNVDYLRSGTTGFDTELLAGVRSRGPQTVGLTGRTPNIRSITDPNEMRYHRRILGNFMRNLPQRRDAQALAVLAEEAQLPENLEQHIAMEYLGAPNRYRGPRLGGKRTRKSKKTRRQTRRRR